MKPYNARVIVPTARTAVPLSYVPKSVSELHIQSLSENTGKICVGGPGVLATAGERNSPHLNAGENFSWKVPTDLSLWWIDATVSNEGVCILAIISE